MINVTDFSKQTTEGSEAIAQENIGLRPGTSEGDPDRYLTTKQLTERLQISYACLHEWLKQEDKGLPRPYFFGRLKRFKLKEIEEWEQNQPRCAVDAVQKRRAHNLVREVGVATPRIGATDARPQSFPVVPQERDVQNGGQDHE